MINVSDYFAIGILIIAYVISNTHLFSKFFNLPITEDEKKSDDYNSKNKI